MKSLSYIAGYNDGATGKYKKGSRKPGGKSMKEYQEGNLAGAAALHEIRKISVLR